jgi:hypothetical protein
MNDSAHLNQLSDAVDLLKMLEHLTESFRGVNAGGPGVPWAGILLTLQQSRGLVSSALESLTVTSDRQGPREGQEAPRAGVRELVDDANYQGTFQRVQLPREQPRETVKDPLEH